jgi:hypothetical protein
MKPFVVDVTKIFNSPNGAPSTAEPVTTVQFTWDYKWQAFPDDLVAIFRKGYPASAQANFRFEGGQWKLLGVPVLVRQGLIP